MPQHSYQQPEKQLVRERILTRAVQVLTSERPSAPLVLPDELVDTVELALKNIGDSDLPSRVVKELEQWLVTYGSKVGAKVPSDLKVLYLCGPEPMNDLSILLAQGINPHNVWAVESGRRDFNEAITALKESGVPVKVHHGDLAQFFESYQEQFDLVYYDACGSILSRRPNTLDPILKLLGHARLEPISALVTNFAFTDELAERHARVMAAYFRYRYRDQPDVFHESGLDPQICQHESEELFSFVKHHATGFYTDFVTRFLVDLARYWIPNCRALAARAVAEQYLADNKTRKDSLVAAELYPPDPCRAKKGQQSVEDVLDWARQAGDIVLSPSSYPVYSFYRLLKSEKPPDFLVDQLGNLKIGGQELGKFLGYASLMDHVLEGHWKVLSEPMLRAVALSWFDQKHPFSCDAPLPNLLINSLLGIYGRPAFPNPRQCVRLKYRAKQTEMFTDLLVLDQCRYYYDWFPTVEQSPARFESVAFQVLARCILDRIERADWNSDSHPFRGAAVASAGEIPVAKLYTFAPREAVSLPEHK